MIKLLKPLLVVLITFKIAASVALAKAESFAPTWKLMSQTEKRSFVSGFVQGWRYSSDINNLMLQFVKKHPDKAVDSIEDVARLYRVKFPELDTLIGRLDEFYANPENSSSGISKAISAAIR